MCLTFSCAYTTNFCWKWNRKKNPYFEKRFTKKNRKTYEVYNCFFGNLMVDYYQKKLMVKKKLWIILSMCLIILATRWVLRLMCLQVANKIKEMFWWDKNSSFFKWWNTILKQKLQAQLGFLKEIYDLQPLRCLLVTENIN